MADGTKIEWADATLNYVNGCSLESPGCTNCYAMKQAHRFPVRQGLTVKTKGGMVWTGEVRENPNALEQALAWKRGRAIFWNAHGDLFHPSVPDAWIDRQFAAFALTPQHRHMILTKRSARMREYFARYDAAHDDNCADLVARAVEGMNISDAAQAAADHRLARWPLPNVWLGVSVEDQKRADERIPDLLATPAAVRFISAEPLLGQVFPWAPNILHDAQRLLGKYEVPGVDWVIAGGESGLGARPMHPDWARSLRDQCAAAGVAFHFKQNGEFAPGEIAGDYLDPDRPAKGMTLFDGRWGEAWSHPDGHADDEPDVYRVGKKRAGRLLDGVEHNGVPA